ncbi:winged helix-turn-helix transcriptional regulator [Pectinatus haikarae]|uniref:DNA-binding HxlR family transcriptional regulator n=1 Tax=Pectinatus haikarae TaxID=349096 RepID=A0ABT9Y7P8_9FIRM|nr:helix-turn-helix domain-containing protein [Pectinatus haikarae]MDQ0203860.1 DNA-binding HxlR family transcriptional regulator [Pectinatus haikarae]
MDTKTTFGKCPYFTSQKVLTGKWSLLIMHYLDGKTLRFNELEKLLTPIAQATLTKQLRILEGHGLIKRKICNQIPPRVEYSLSDIGNEFKPVLNSLELWGDKYIEYIKKNENAVLNA